MDSPYDSLDPVSAPPKRPPWSRRRKVIVAMLVLLGVGVGGFWLFNRAGAIRRDTELDALRAAGRPITIDELDSRRIKIPDAANSALKIVPLFDDLDKRVARLPLPVFGDLGADWAGLGERLSPEMLELIGRYLDARADLLAKLHDAAKLKQGAYPVAWAPDGISTLLPHLQHVRTAVRLLSLEALYRANRGDMDGAMDSSLAAFRVAGSIGDEPLLICVLVRIAGEGAALDALEQVLALGKPDDAWLIRFRAELAPMADDNRLLVDACDGERVSILTFFGELKKGRASLASVNSGPQTVSAGQAIFWKLTSGYLDMNVSQYLRQMRPSWTAANLPLKDYIRALKASDATIQNLSAFYAFARMLTPSMGGAAERFAESRMRIRATIAALDAEAFYRRQGHWPARLDDLLRAPDLPAGMLADIFNGDKPMKYLVRDDGCVIYSVGRDGVDNGGDVTGPKGTKRTDIGFQLLSPQRRGARTTTQPIEPDELERMEKLRPTTQPATTWPAQTGA